MTLHRVESTHGVTNALTKNIQRGVENYGAK
jgi:hypothetical protein